MAFYSLPYNNRNHAPADSGTSASERYEADIHTHTIASGHGSSATITDMVKAAAARNLKLLGISDHGPATLGGGRTSYFRNLRYAQRERLGIRMVYGAEANILNYEGKLGKIGRTAEGQPSGR